MSVYRKVALASSSLVFLAAIAPAWALDNSVAKINAAPGDLPASLTGTGVAIGQIELGSPDRTHTGLPAAQITNLNEILTSSHATQVAGVMVSKGGTLAGDAGKIGVAPEATIQSWAIANATLANTAANYSANIVEGADKFVGVKVVNMSNGISAAPNGTSRETMAVDWFANNKNIVWVVAAGNDGENGSGSVTRPGDCFNCITVGATGPTDVFNKVSAFSSEGRTTDLRNKPDIVAPGEGISTTTRAGGPPPDAYTSGAAGQVDGTSFAAPHVAGVAALVSQFAAAGGADVSRQDHRVAKAVLLNSAMKDGGEKTGEFEVRDKNNNLWLPTLPGIDSLDDQLGAGQVNAAAAFTQFTPKEAEAGLTASTEIAVDPIAWDFQRIAAGATVDYNINLDLLKGSKLTATLIWDRAVERTACSTAGCLSFRDDTFTAATLRDLDLYLLDAAGNELNLFDAKGRASRSTSPVDSVEHIYFELPEDGKYSVRVRSTATDAELFGLALWSHAVPEPATLSLFVAALAVFAGLRRRSSPTTA